MSDLDGYGWLINLSLNLNWELLGCDFVMKNFKLRQQARRDELEAIDLKRKRDEKGLRRACRRPSRSSRAAPSSSASESLGRERRCKNKA